MSRSTSLAVHYLLSASSRSNLPTPVCPHTRVLKRGALTLSLSINRTRTRVPLLPGFEYGIRNRTSPLVAGGASELKAAETITSCPRDPMAA